MDDMILVSVKQPSDYARGYATIGDIMKQLARAIATPFEGGSAG